MSQAFHLCHLASCPWLRKRSHMVHHSTISCAHSPTFPSLHLCHSSFSNPFCCFTYVTAHSPTLPLLHLCHSSFYNPSFASPTSQNFHLHHLVIRPCSAMFQRLICSGVQTIMFTDWTGPHRILTSMKLNTFRTNWTSKWGLERCNQIPLSNWMRCCKRNDDAFQWMSCTNWWRTFLTGWLLLYQQEVVPQSSARQMPNYFLVGSVSI